ncbi:DUF4838 domain-containing protein [Paenibacillus contaminans]|uniref:Dockerin domain-containing protein n=1 Tax=Paenibacillus contaminans TaxID=450362 RepID=A0A329MJD4_9BACL|nr:DUF4838 domain-containing protein [Paenibacillus contaminans]RAV20061.1 hypothetical protein DQG23_16435 [Paenibacillus contaminans]
MKKRFTRNVSIFVCLALLLSLFLAAVPLPAHAETATPAASNLMGTYREPAQDPPVDGSGLELAAGAEGRATIVVTASATDLEKQAADELQLYIERLSGAKLPVATAAAASGVNIFVGGASPDPQPEQIRAGGTNMDSFRLSVGGDRIQLVGLTDRGTLFAAYELLEQLGVRWFAPGEIGTEIPSLATVRVKEQNTIQHPGVTNRYVGGMDYLFAQSPIEFVDEFEGKAWMQHRRGSSTSLPLGDHGMPCGITSAQRPDLYIQVNGRPTNQYDVTKPEVLACVVDGALAFMQANPDAKYISMGPLDGDDFGTTAWDADDFDPLMGSNSITDRYVKFYNQVLEQIEPQYPNVGIAFFAYLRYMRAPVREIPNPKLLPVIAPITVERMHSIKNDMSWERSYLEDLIDDWKKLGVNVSMYSYMYNLADPGMPFSLINRVVEEMNLYRDKDMNELRFEVLPSWAYQGPSLYLMANLSWNPELDVQKTLSEYFAKYYGPAAEPMWNHFRKLEDAIINADYYTGAVFDFLKILTPDVMASLETTLAEAESKVSADSIYAKRVRMNRVAFDFGKAFTNMRGAYLDFDFVKAKQHYDEAKTLLQTAALHSPVIIHPWAGGYIDVFWKYQIEQSYERVIDGNELVAKLPDEWLAMFIPGGNGEKLGLWKPGIGTQSWMKLKTFSETWSNQGLRYYKGEVWYRTSIDVADQYKDKPLRLWFGDIDESPRVWVNGTEIQPKATGIATVMPWEYDVSGAIKFGQKNDIVVSVRNQYLDELGTGGIVGPAMLWAPANRQGPTDPDELLTNPGFEDGMTGWTPYNYSILSPVKDPVHSGSKSLGISSRSGYYTGPMQDIKSALLENGPGTYDFSAMLRTESDTQNMYAAILIVDNGTYRSYVSSIEHVGSGEWSKASGSVEITWSGNLDLALIFTESQPESGNGNYFVDDFSLKKHKEAPPSKSTLTTSSSSIPAGTPFKVNYGLSSVNQAVYAQDIQLDYDPAVMEFVSAKSLIEGVSIVETVKEPEGKLRLIVVSQGSEHAVTGNAQVAEITFKAKSLSKTASGAISITSAKLGDEQGNEIQAELSSISVEITAANPGGGDGGGDGGGTGEMNADINQDGAVSIGDLSIMAAYYGIDNTSPNWEQAKKADVNKDGKIDIVDLAAVAKKIVG